jgi:hypothetical protein
MKELIGTVTDTARLGAGTGAANYHDDKEAGKLVKLVADSRYDLCAAGNEIEGRIVTVDTASSDDYSTGSVQKTGRMEVLADGFQANPGVANTIAVLDYVVAGTPTAKGTALAGGRPKVCKATDQTVAKNSPFAWRVVSILSGNGGLGSVLTIEKVGNAI